MAKCIFCELDNTKRCNTIIEETDSFLIMPALGSLVEGYLLIVNKTHLNSFSELNKQSKEEYIQLIKKYRIIFKEIYGVVPIIFEHGTTNIDGLSASSVSHAHSHIVNHHYTNEKDILAKEHFERINSFLDVKLDTNYIYYKSDNGIDYVSYDYEPISQLMRIFIARDLNIEDSYNWRTNPFEDNMEKTIKKILKRKEKNE